MSRFVSVVVKKINVLVLCPSTVWYSVYHDKICAFWKIFAHKAQMDGLIFRVKTNIFGKIQSI